MPNDAEEMKKSFSPESDDALRYDFNTLEVNNVTEFKEYHGVKVTIFAYLDRTRVPVSAVAERFEAFVSLGLANSRYKDLYDMQAL